MMLLMAVLAGKAAAAPPVVLESDRLHLGQSGIWEWDSFKDRPVDAPRLELRFQGKANATTQTLRIWQRDVKLTWPVLLNGKPVGALVTAETALESLLAIPPGALQDGENVLTIEAPSVLDDIEVGPVSLHSGPIQEVLGEARLEVTVLDGSNGKAIPCRLTLTKSDGTLQPMLAEPAGGLA